MGDGAEDGEPGAAAGDAELDAVESGGSDGEAVDPDAGAEVAWVREIVRLTRRARTLEAADEAAATTDDGDTDERPGERGGPDPGELRRERERIAADHGYGVRFRERDETVVCYPLDWLDGDTVDPAAVEDTGRAVEVPLTGGEDDVEAVRETNDAVLDPLLEDLDDALGYNAAAFAEYCENHHRAPVDAVGTDEVAWFLEEYYPRNVWPPDEAEGREREALRELFDRVDRDDLVDWLERRSDAGPDDGSAGRD